MIRVTTAATVLRLSSNPFVWTKELTFRHVLLVVKILSTKPPSLLGYKLFQSWPKFFIATLKSRNILNIPVWDCKCGDGKATLGACTDDNDDCDKKSFLFLFVVFLVIFFEFLPPTVVPIARLYHVQSITSECTLMASSWSYFHDMFDYLL